MPETKSATKPEVKKAVIITDPKNGVLTIAIPMNFEGSETPEAGPMDALVDFLQTFCLAPEKKPEAGFWSKDQNPCPFQCQCRSDEESAEIKAKLETASSEFAQSGLTPEQELRLKCLEMVSSPDNSDSPEFVTIIAGIYFKWVTTGIFEGIQSTPGKA